MKKEFNHDPPSLRRPALLCLSRHPGPGRQHRPDQSQSRYSPSNTRFARGQHGYQPYTPTLPDGSDPRTQGNDSGRQGGADTDGTRQDPMEGTRPQTGSEGEGNADSN